MRNDVTGKTVVVGIALIFVFGAFIPAVGSQSKSVYDVGSSEMIKIGVEESIDSQAVSGYTESWDIGNTVLSMFTQTIIGLVNIVANNPIVNGISDMITGDEKSNDDNVSIGASTAKMDEDKLSLGESELKQTVNNPAPLDSGDPWWNSDWPYSKKITIDHTKVGATLTNFPILFDNTSSDFAHAQSDGDDFAFVDSTNTTQYNHEIEDYNSTTNRLIAWVNITTLSADTDTVDITVLKLHCINLKYHWNLVSLPFNESIDKTDIIVRNGSQEYNWTEAFDAGIIVSHLYDWNRTGQAYKPPSKVTTMEPGRGYWMWAYYNCELLIPSNTVGDGYITDLKVSWNIMGQPYNTSLAKGDLIICNNSIDYSWDQAVENNTILGFIYGWNRTMQMYELSDEFNPGYGYWMYAYYDCILKREIS